MIRPVRHRDVPVVLELIRELASYEFAPDAVEASEEDLRGALSADQPAVFAHVAVEDEEPRGGGVVGVAVWYLSFSTWTGRHGIHLVDLVVNPGARGRGHGEALFGELVRICVERGYARLEWETLDALADHADRQAPQGFYRRQGGVPRQGWTSWRMDHFALRRYTQLSPDPSRG